jgi:branched-chain amino acid transport system substrate-binding protein
VTHPGVEQKATWLQIRQQRPDYVFLWGWGVMNSTSIKEAIAVRIRACRCMACGGPPPSLM